MKKFEFPLNIYSAVIVVLLFALLRLSHAIMVLTHTKAVTKTTDKVKTMGDRIPANVGKPKSAFNFNQIDFEQYL